MAAAPLQYPNDGWRLLVVWPLKFHPPSFKDGALYCARVLELWGMPVVMTMMLHIVFTLRIIGSSYRIDKEFVCMIAQSSDVPSKSNEVL